MLPEIVTQADSGYQGIKELHPNSELPVKSSKKHPLTKEQKKENRRLSRSRVFIENVNRVLKVFKILSERYRNRRKKFGLRLNLIAGISNLHLNILYCKLNI
jgi:IS5 family transposase